MQTHRHEGAFALLAIEELKGGSVLLLRDALVVATSAASLAQEEEVVGGPLSCLGS
jgi:hypothetical protein